MRKYSKREMKVAQFIDDMSWLFDVSSFEKDIKFGKIGEGGQVGAQIMFDTKYQRFTIDIDDEVFFGLSKKQQRKVLLHELCHSVTAELADNAKQLLGGKLVCEKDICDANERATSRIENFLDGLLQGRKRYAKKYYSDYLK